jgi:prophage regulatory protein
MYLKDSEVAARLSISRPTLWRWVKNPEVRFPPPLKLGPSCTRWKLSDVEQWEAEREKQKGAA